MEGTKVVTQAAPVTKHPATTTQPSNYSEVTTDRPQATDNIWKDVFNGISSGSWAVLLTVAVIWLVSKDSIKKYLEKHISLLETMQSSLKDNADSITKLAESEVQQTSSMATLQANDKQLAEGLKKVTKKVDHLTDLIYDLHDSPDDVVPEDKRLAPRRRSRYIREEEEV